MQDQFSLNRNSEVNLAVALAAALAFILTVSFIFGSGDRGDISVPTETVRKPFPEVALEAKAAFVYDIRDEKVIFTKNATERLALASLTKVMTALTAYELGASYGTVTVSPEALSIEGDSGLYAGERWSLKNILDFALVSSSNDGMRAVALALGALERAEATDEEIVQDFVSAMNTKASQLGLKNTYFWNETGLDESLTKGGAYGSAEDVSALMRFVLEHRPEIFAYTNEDTLYFTSESGQTHVVHNTNPLISEIPGLLASKTGYTSTAGGNLSIIFDPDLGRPIIVTVLGSSINGRFEDVRTLVRATMDYIEN